MDMSFVSGNEHGLVLTSDVEKASFDHVWAWHDCVRTTMSGRYASFDNGDTLDFYYVTIEEMIIKRDYISIMFSSEPSTYSMTFENVPSTCVALEELFHNVGYEYNISFHFKRDGDKRVFSYCINNE